ncbi:Lrp/AsnC family transcriptional regulator [Dactylosporangium sp. CA-092794]|uniref:Lrp/AsnC family transcriptional regulator n=1 Tax=Dactylosporangium sp. CA-092794 TaxID=3239929 RepID=UPI003D905237
MQLDDVDLALLRLLVEEPRAGSREYARLLGIARGTVASRIARLERAGTVTGYAAQVSPAGLGYGVEAFIHLHLAQGKLDDVTARLTEIPQILEAHSTTGDGDVLCRVVAESNSGIEALVQTLLAIPGVVRTRTEISLSQRVPYRVLPLLHQAARRADS